MTQTDTLAPVAVPKDEGEALWFFGQLVEVKVKASDTGGAMSLLEVTAPPNLPGVLHVHHQEEEGFFILEGSATFQVGNRTIEARAGDYLLGPRDIPHKYDTGPDGCRMLFLMTPGGFEDLVRELGVPAQERVVPPPAMEPPDLERVARIAMKYGNELLEG